MNIHIAVGRVSDIRMGETANGSTVASFGVITENFYNGEKHTTRHPIKLYGKAADNFERLVSVGDLVKVVSRYESFSYERDGEKKYGHNFIGQSWEKIYERRNTGENAGDEEESDFEPEEDGLPF